MGSDGPMPVFNRGIGMYEIVVRNAWEIGMNDPDAAGVLADDDVIVPAGTQNPPVQELQQWQKKRDIKVKLP